MSLFALSSVYLPSLRAANLPTHAANVQSIDADPAERARRLPFKGLRQAQTTPSSTPLTTSMRPA